MSSAISCIVIKSDRPSQKIPQLGEVLRITGEPGLFIVMSVDPRRRIVQLMEKSGRHHLREVPFSSVRVMNRKLARTLQRFLDSRIRTQHPPESDDNKG